MTTHMTGTREEWLAARLELLEAEKELTRRSDELARRRQELPWVRVDKEYRFETDEGSASLADLFRGRSQLLVYHFMFGPDYTAGCPSCSAIADGFNGFVVHLANHDVTLSAVSRAPLAKLQAYKRRMGWTFPWASSFGSDFNFDFNVSFTEEQQREGGIEYNYRRGGHAMDAAPVPPARRPVRGHMRNRRAHVLARQAGHERVRARGRRRLPHLFHLCARTGRPLGHVPVARPRPQGAQRDGRLVAPPRRVRHALSQVMDSVGATVMNGISHDAQLPERAFFVIMALLFAVSAAVTIVRCASMSAMGEMPMPGGWTMSMAWMRMPGQTWLGAAASFLGMWVVMMVAMMLPSLMPMLWRYRQAVGRAGRETRLGRLTALVGMGYFFVWAVIGMAVFPLGAALAAVEMQLPALARAVPVAVGVVVLIAGALQFSGGRHIALPAAGRRRGVAVLYRRMPARPGGRPAPRPALQLLLCRPDGDPACRRGHGPARDGCRDGGHHRRTSRTGR